LSGLPTSVQASCTTCSSPSASEDKESIVRPLAHALVDRGVKVWYDEFTMRVGDSLRRKIDTGIARSRFGLVVPSHAFFAKRWTQYELDGLVTMAVDERQILLPIWHGVSKDEVIGFSPSLADRVALNTSVSTVAEIADELAAVILGDTALDDPD
jgi:TIR domain-containing protein